MLKLLFSFVFTLSYLCSFAQPSNKNFIGKWEYYGTEAYQTFYPVNSWNKETLTLNENHTFEHHLENAYGDEFYSQTKTGTWNLANDSTIIVLKEKNESFQNNQSIQIIYLQLKQLSPNFLVTFNPQNTDIVKQYRKKGCTVDLKTDQANYLLAQQQLVDSVYFQQVKDYKKATLKPYNIHAYLFENKLLLPEATKKRTTKTLTYGKILKVTDTSVVIQPKFRYSTYFTNDGFKHQNMEQAKDGIVAPLELLKKNINSAYDPVSLTGMKISAGFTALSVVTSLIVAPIVCATSKTPNQGRNFGITFGSGIIGIGIGTGSFFLFKSMKRTFTKDKHVEHKIFLSKHQMP